MEITVKKISWQMLVLYAGLSLRWYCSLLELGLEQSFQVASMLLILFSDVANHYWFQQFEEAAKFWPWE